MGMIHVTAIFRNPAEPRRRWQGSCLVDTGAIDCMLPASELHKLGFEAVMQRTYELADGSEATFGVAVADVEVMGERVGVSVIFGPEGVEPIIGVTALESAGLEIDPRSQRLKRLPAVRLKSAVA